MSKLTKNQIASRRKRMQEEALKSVAKSEQLNIRIDENSITRLYELAAKRKKAVGAMVREWIVEKIQSTNQPESGESVKSLTDLVLSLHKRIDRLDAASLEKNSLLVSEQIEGTETEAYAGYFAINQGAHSSVCNKPDVSEYVNQETSTILQRLESLEKEVRRLARRK